MKKQNIKPSLVLGSICLVVAFLLSFVNMVTGPIIKAAQDAAANEALLVVLPDGSNFEEITIDDKYPAVIDKGYKADGGYVFRASVTGKSSGLIIMTGIDASGKIVATAVIADQETDSYDAKVFPNVEGTDSAYSGMALDSFEPYLVSGATLTSAAYGNAVKAALQAFVIANGGEVDVRTPEQILQDNCNAALDSEGVKFSRWFATEVLEGVEAVYEAEDGSGEVFVIDGKFWGAKANGAQVNVDVDYRSTLAAASDKKAASKLTEITELPETINTKTVSKVYVTDSGNYVFELVAKGYQALFDYGNGAVINIKLSISADGKIIDCVTLSQDESKGYGDVCATEEYYAQYRGASKDDIKVTVKSPDAHDDQISPDNTDVGVIASATFTTYGYQKAVKAAFDAYEILTGGEAND